MADFKIIGEQCEDCGYPIERNQGYWVRNVITNKRRRICGFCWCNPGWPALDPEYRERQISEYRERQIRQHQRTPHVYSRLGLLGDNSPRYKREVHEPRLT